MFLRAWLRAVLGAGSAGLVVPAGLVLAVVAAATIGGASLGGLGQLFGGPSVPGTSGARLGTAEIRGGMAADDVPSVPARASRAGRRASATPRTARGSAARPVSSGQQAGGSTGTGRYGGSGSSTIGSGTAGTGTGSGGSGSGTGGSGSPTPTTTPATSTPAPAASAPAAPAAPAETNPVRQLGQGVQSALDTAPAPVGPGLSDAVGTVVDLVAPAKKP